MAIITALVLLNSGRQVDYGFFCRGCRDGTDVNAMHSRIKYTTKEMPGHIARYGRTVEQCLFFPGMLVVETIELVLMKFETLQS